MVQIVFVHGVAAPRDPVLYNQVSEHRQQFFDKFCFQETAVTYHNPHWAPHGAPGEETYKTVPKGKSGALLALGDTSLGGAGGEDVGSLASTTDIGLGGNILTQMAKDDFPGLLNSLAIAAVDGGHNLGDESVEIASNIADYLIKRSDDSENSPLAG